MTRERTKELIECLQAYAEGKTIQFFCRTFNEWTDVKEPVWDNNIQYRVKPEPKLRPYTFKELKEAIKKHGGYVVDEEGCVCVIVHANNSCVRYYDDCFEDYSDFMRNKWLDDNSPCGFFEE